MTRYKLTILFLLFLPLFALGDAIMTTRAMTASTIAEVFVEKDQVRVEIEIGMNDIPAFKNILPDSVYEDLGYEPRPLTQRIEHFFQHDLVLEADGKIVRGGIRQMEPRKRLIRDEITGETLPSQSQGEDILFAEFIFPIENSPATLSIRPPLTKEGYVSATIGLMVYHLDLPVMDFRYLSQKETLQLDWEDPWYSRFENKNLWRQYNEPISVFLYAEPFETRVEVIVRPKDIQQWYDLGIADLEKLPVAIQAELKEKIADFLLEKMKLTVDGESVVPELQRINFLKRTLKSSMIIDPPQELNAISATLGIIYSVPTMGLPKESQLVWNLFSPKMQDVRAASTDEAGPLPYRLRPDDNVLIWKNFLTNPTIPGIKVIAVPVTTREIKLPVGSVLSLVITVLLVRTVRRKKGNGMGMAVGGLGLACSLLIYPFTAVPISLSAEPELSDVAATELVSGILENVYASFDFRDENSVYDALDHSLVGDLLSEVYLQTMKSLELASQGGARVKVKGIRLERAEFSALKNGFKTRCVWDVMGSVGHWGHIHQRINRYEAELSIQPVEGQWKITALDILQEERLK